MTDTKTPPSYAQLLETNYLIQASTDETYWLCLTRTVQESKLFPVPAYMMMSYVMAFYRYPELLRKVETYMSAEEIGDRMRSMSMKCQNPSMGWALPGVYLLGREWLINLGLIRPSDAVEDIVTVMDFWKRFQLSWHRNSGHLMNSDYGHRGQILAERQISGFHADLYDCIDGDELHVAAQAFMASASQYGFLISCESRISLSNSGPYPLSDNVQMIVRDFMDLSESDFPWLDDVAADVPFNNITVTMAVKDTHFYLVDDWGSFESEPEFKAENVVGVGLYVSDNLSGGYQPLAMESRDALIARFRELEEQVRDATTRLWRRIAGWSRDEMMDAGAITYFSMIKDIAHIAGCYDVDDWMQIDVRADRLRPLLNDEYSRDVLGELVGYLSLPSQQLNDYTMAKHHDDPRRMFSHIPHAILADEPWTARCGPVGEGVTYLAPKKDAYTTTRGRMTLAEYNRLSREAAADPVFHADRMRCETWVKYHAGTEAADALYTRTQARSRTIAGAGSMARRGAAGAGVGAEAPPELPDYHLVLHGAAIRKAADAAAIAELIGLPLASVTRELAAAIEGGRAAQAGERYMLTAPGQMALRAEYSRFYEAARREPAMTAAYDRFESINSALKSLITDWQTVEVGGSRLPNDHNDKDHDAAIIDRLGALHERFAPVLADMARFVPRLAAHGDLLMAALEHAEDGDIAWVSDATIASYHTVWFEMHEDLLRILGREREE